MLPSRVIETVFEGSKGRPKGKARRKIEDLLEAEGWPIWEPDSYENQVTSSMAILESFRPGAGIGISFRKHRTKAD
jgi:hypothetical protein